jgi:hypothetical protein
MSIQDIAGGAQIAAGADPVLQNLLASGDYAGASWADVVGADPMAALAPPVHPMHHAHHGFPGGYTAAAYQGATGPGVWGQDPRAAFIRQLMAKNAALVVDRPMNRSRDLPLGFPIATLSGGTPEAPSGALSVTQPQTLYRGRRLFLIPSGQGVCVLQDLKVGKDSQLDNSEPVPAEMFAPLSFGGDMNIDTAQVSMIVSLFLGNIGTPEISVTAGLQGTAVF